MADYEGQYFVFDFCSDFTMLEKGQALAVFKVKEGKLEEIFHPCDDGVEGEMGCIGGKQNLKAIEILKKEGVKIVYSILSNSFNELFGFRLFLGEPGKDEDWYAYWGIVHTYHECKFKEEGIELRLYEENKK